MLGRLLLVAVDGDGLARYGLPVSQELAALVEAGLPVAGRLFGGRLLRGLPVGAIAEVLAVLVEAGLASVRFVGHNAPYGRGWTFPFLLKHFV